MLIEKNISKYSRHFSHYTELRIQENRGTQIMLTNGDVTGNVSGSQSGVSARVFKDGNWGFSSNPEINNDSIAEVVNSSIENVKFMNKKDSTRCGLILPETIGAIDVDFSTKKNHENQKFWVEFAREIDAYIEKKYPKLISRNVSIRSLDMEKSLTTSDGSNAYSLIPRSILFVMVAVEKNGAPVELYELFGGLGQKEDNLLSPSDYFIKIDDLINRLNQKANGVFPKAGLKDVVLDADLAGILAHEAIGHTTEADFVLGGSIAGDFLNEKVASSLVTLVDYANTCMNKTCPVPVYIDDEGTKSEDVVIIKDGILKNFMHNKESANHFEAQPKNKHI